MTQDPWPTTRLSLLLKLQDLESDQAWGDFVQRYRPPIVRLIRDVFRLQEAEAEDIAQNVLIKLVKAMQTFSCDPKRKFRAWLRTVTRNAVRDSLRSGNRHLAKGTGDSRVKQMLEGQPERTDEMADVVMMELHRDILRDTEQAVCQRFESHTWQAYLASRDGKAARDIAQEMNMSTAAVYKAKSKVTKLIREEIAKTLASPKFH